MAGVIIVSSGFRETGAEGALAGRRRWTNRKDLWHEGHGPELPRHYQAHLGLNTTPLRSTPLSGNIAFISQSGAFGRALLEWGIETHLGFSMFASLGPMIDVDLGDLIDFLGYEPHTRSIMIYMEEGIGDVRKFISAARGFARNKPIVLLKPAGVERRTQSLSHTGYLATSDRVHDAVFRGWGSSA